MTSRAGLIALLAAGVVLLGLAVTLGLRAYRAEPRAAVAATAVCPANAKKANLDFTMNDLNGKPVRLADFSGKVLLLDFWATWCVPCEVEIPGFVDLRERYKSRGFEVVGLVALDEFKNARPFASAHGMNYPILNAVDRADIESAFGPLDGLPTSFVISRDGRICAEHAGVPGLDRPGPSIQQSIERVFEAEIQPLL
jgi:peroxiredoxin